MLLLLSPKDVSLEKIDKDVLQEYFKHIIDQKVPMAAKRFSTDSPIMRETLDFLQEEAKYILERLGEHCLL